MTDNVKDVGVLGLGIIGEIWAGHLREAGRLGGCWNRTPKPEVAGWRESPEEVVDACRIVFIVVADPPAVEGLLNRICPRLTREHVVIQSSTIDPESSERFHRRVAETGARYLEAPFTGSKPAAEARKTVFYLGGDPRLIDEVEPVLALVSGKRFRIGAPGQAAALKLAMNLQIAIQAEALSESLSFARKAGIEDGMYFEVLRENAGWSGLAALKEPKLRTKDFTPQFSVKHMHKDVRLALSGEGTNGDFPLTAVVRECLARAEEAGMGDDDFISVIRMLE